MIDYQIMEVIFHSVIYNTVTVVLLYLALKVIS